MKIKVIYGPPCAGKSTYVNESISDNDIRFDYDLIMQSISNRNSHVYSDNHLPYVVQYRELIISMAAEDDKMDTAYILATKITNKLQEELEGKNSEFLLIETSKEQCYENLNNDETRPDKDFWKEKIDSWFDWYEDYLKEVKNLKDDHKDKKQQSNKFWEIKMSANKNTADIFIYGEITKYAWEDYGEVSSIIFKNELEALGDGIETINLYINSPGGSVFEAMAMISMLQRHPADIISHIDGVAASCASVLPMISKRIIMPSNSLMMIHHAMTGAWGNAKQLRKAADDVERISKAMCQYYLDRAGDKMSEETLSEMLEEDTWLTAEQCLELGLCDEIVEANQAVAYAFDDKWAKQYQNVPKQLLHLQSSTPTMSVDEKALREKIAEEAKANAEYINTILGGIHL
ncbi:hypothetical protein BAMA111019_23060 [Bacillus manliponensis]